MVAEDRLSNAAIAAAVGITRQALDKWKAHPAFAQRVREHLDAFAETVRRRGIASIEHRVAALQERWERMNQVLAERAADPALANVPGGKSGLIVRRPKKVEVEWAEDMGGGTTREEISEYAVDTGLLAQLLAHERQAAQELGQWTERKELTGKGGGPIGLELTGIDDLTDEELRERLARASGGAPDGGVSA